jgi:hypothetical protein
MDKDTQAQTLKDYGVLIEERLEKEDQVLVYQMQSFYAEVYYHKGYKIIKKLRSFTNADNVFPYVKNADLSNFKLN